MFYESTLERLRIIHAKLKRDLYKVATTIEVVECLWKQEERKEKKILVTRLCQLLASRLS